MVVTATTAIFSVTIVVNMDIFVINVTHVTHTAEITAETAETLETAEMAAEKDVAITSIVIMNTLLVLKV